MTKILKQTTGLTLVSQCGQTWDAFMHNLPGAEELAQEKARAEREKRNSCAQHYFQEYKKQSTACKHRISALQKAVQKEQKQELKRQKIMERNRKAAEREQAKKSYFEERLERAKKHEKRLPPTANGAQSSKPLCVASTLPHVVKQSGVKKTKPIENAAKMKKLTGFALEKAKEYGLPTEWEKMSHFWDALNKKKIQILNEALLDPDVISITVTAVNQRKRELIEAAKNSGLLTIVQIPDVKAEAKSRIDECKKAVDVKTVEQMKSAKMTECPVCKVAVRKDRLEAHLKKVHDGDSKPKVHNKCTGAPSMSSVFRSSSSVIRPYTPPTSGLKYIVENGEVVRIGRGRAYDNGIARSSSDSEDTWIGMGHFARDNGRFGSICGEDYAD